MLRVLCALSASRGFRLLENLHAVRPESLHVRVLDNPRSSLLHEVDRTMPDIVIYDPEYDHGAFFADGSLGGPHAPAIICVSDDTTYAVQAFHVGALHYLSYDAVVHELQCAIARCRVVILGSESPMLLREHVQSLSPSHDVIALPVFSGIELRDRRSIVRIQGERSYTRVVLLDDPPIILSRTIRDFAPALENSGLLRVHRSHLVNIAHVRRIIRGKTPRLQMCNGDEVEVSGSYRDALFASVRMVERRTG